MMWLTYEFIHMKFLESLHLKYYYIENKSLKSGYHAALNEKNTAILVIEV